MAFAAFPIPTREYNPPDQRTGVATITRASASDGWLHSADPSASIALSPALPDAAYAVHVDLISADDLGRVGQVVAYDRAANGFKLRFTGATSNVQVRWTTTRI